jgi:hypothetical protein
MTNVDWAKRRSECSLEAIFNVSLKELLDSDVESVNQLKRRGVEFVLDTHATNKIVVSRRRDMGGTFENEAVVFDLLPNEIRVRDARTEKTMFSAKPTLNAEGECLIEIAGLGDPIRLWQFSSKALENLFFGF